ncbi:MAG: hypothetical protein ACFFDF_14095 [Candidatus Odinarchaeota archaeon]
MSITIVIASDNDFDGIDDEYEKLNKRDIQINFSDGTFDLSSILRTGIVRDKIEYYIKYDNDGINIELQYMSNYEEQNNIELNFSISFRKLIEFVDMDANGIYNDSIDQTLQVVEINDFSQINYSQILLSPNTKLHHVKLGTKDGVFTTHFYFSEEFTTVNNSLITPSESKIDIEINNFNYTNPSSQLALYVNLESDSDYNKEEETEDESLGFAYNESSVFTSNMSRIGFLSWKKSAIVDGNESEILVSPIEVDDDNVSEQKLYVNYPRGQEISHDPKLGVQGILKLIPLPPFPFVLTVIILILAAISISIAYAAYHYREILLPSIFLVNEKKKETKKSFITISGYSDAKIDEMLSNPQLTAISPDFIKLVDLLELSNKEKEEFIKEMLALNPFERKIIINEMIKKSKL